MHPPPPHILAAQAAAASVPPTGAPASVSVRMKKTPTATPRQMWISSNGGVRLTPGLQSNGSQQSPPQPVALPPAQHAPISGASGGGRAATAMPHVDAVEPAEPTPELFSLFSETLSRRAESRMSPSTLSTSPSSFESAPIKRERSLLSPGAEGKLLVPDVKLKVRSPSSASLSGTCTSRGSSSRRSVRSPVTPSDPEALTPLRSKRPPVETRSWSYDNVLTYPVMPHPTRIVKTKEMCLVVSKEISVIVETEKPAQKLFLFPVQYPVTS
ncbi:hypothetical protein DFP72DRAFT_1102070 [Ephemerocybe angulata]|uniref:Uncharacterized protein n=1 Tax=Ephemerocybe angulata TaxID=980116 RepID=A0A8H6HA11_9AGAR|nr:hypothetical protein DFP72DRAFT_1102070 [Tulosesus angulatus]